MIKLRPYQIDIERGIQKKWNEKSIRYPYRNKRHLVVQAPTGAGKCLGINTPILMYDGTIKMVQDIKVGDIIMGDDSKPRHILTIARGQEKLYRVHPSKGDYFVCNESHILSLYKKGNIIDISVKDYLKRKEDAKLFRVGVDFKEREIKVHPYMIGYWLAKDKSDSIPYEYKVNSRKNRNGLLAGIFQVSGTLNNDIMTITTQSKTFGEDILFVARSLGFASYMNDDKVTISLKAEDNILDFTLEDIGVGDYYGFEIDGNRRFLLGDFTVTHNTVIFSDMAQKALAKHNKVLIITHREELMSQTSGTLVDFKLNVDLVTRYTKHPPEGELVVAMTGTLARRIKKPEWQEWYKSFALVVADEIHEQVFNWLFDNPLSKDKYILGFTATPERRGKQRQLRDDYEDMVLGPDVQDLIHMGYLVTDRYFSVPVDIKGVSKKGGEYDSNEMYERFNKQDLYAGVVNNWNRLWKDTITLIFCCNIQHCINTCKAFNNAGIPAKFMVSKLSKPKPLPEKATKEDIAKHEIKIKEYANYRENFSKFSDERQKLIKDWKDGQFKVLINAGIATTGFDFHPIQTVIMNRVTTSPNLLQQIMGRGSRILNSEEEAKYGKKEFFNFGDFGNNCERLGCYYRQPHDYSLDHDEPKPGKGMPAFKTCPKCQSFVTTSSTVCKYCGFVFPKSREEKIVELVEISYADAMKKLETPEDFEIYAKASGKSKNWVFRMIFIRWGKVGLIAYGKKHGWADSYPYMLMRRYQAQNIRK